MLPLFLFFAVHAKAQVRIEFLEILTKSSRITYVGVNYNSTNNMNQTYSPNFDLLQRGLNTLTQRYEAGFAIVSQEYRKLMDLKLMNEKNKLVLKEYQTSVERWANASLSKYDFSINSNVQNVVEFITRAYNDTYIKAEILLLQAVNDKYWQVKLNPRQGLCQKNSYESINSFLDKIKNIDKDDLTKGFTKLYYDFVANKDQLKVFDAYTRRISALETYSSLKTFKPIKNGWNEVYMISESLMQLPESGLKTYDSKITKAYVTNNKINMILKDDGSVYEVSSPIIIKQKTDIIYPYEKCDGTSLSMPYTVYFLGD